MARMIDPTLDEDETQRIHQLLYKYLTIFDLANGSLGQTNAVTHRIDTCTETPIHRVLPSERRTIQQEVDKMLSRDIQS